MRILFDTHALIWFLQGSEKLSEKIRQEILSSNVELCFSSVSILEISIKHSLKPELMPCSPEEVREVAVQSSLREVPFAATHAKIVGELPWHHRDPFDRMLIAQAHVEGMKLLSHDDTVKLYGEMVLPF